MECPCLGCEGCPNIEVLQLPFRHAILGQQLGGGPFFLGNVVRLKGGWSLIESWESTGSPPMPAPQEIKLIKWLYLNEPNFLGWHWKGVSLDPHD